MFPKGKDSLSFLKYSHSECCHLLRILLYIYLIVTASLHINSVATYYEGKIGGLKGDTRKTIAFGNGGLEICTIYLILDLGPLLTSFSYLYHAEDEQLAS